MVEGVFAAPLPIAGDRGLFEARPRPGDMACSRPG